MYSTLIPLEVIGEIYSYSLVITDCHNGGTDNNNSGSFSLIAEINAKSFDIRCAGLHIILIRITWYCIRIIWNAVKVTQPLISISNIFRQTMTNQLWLNVALQLESLQFNKARVSGFPYQLLINQIKNRVFRFLHQEDFVVRVHPFFQNHYPSRIKRQW